MKEPAEELLPYDEAMEGGEEEMGGGEEDAGAYVDSMSTEAGLDNGSMAYMATDPDVEAAADSAIMTGDMGGGICHGCVNFDGQSTCNAFGGPLTVKPEMITSCTEFRPQLTGGGGMEMGGDVGYGAPEFPA